jgi:hypothetical protein
VAEKPDSYLRELAAPFGCSLQSVFTALKNMGITLKKRFLPIAGNAEKNVVNIKRK